MIVTDIKQLKQKCELANEIEIPIIIKSLEEELIVKQGIGLAAPQIGIQKQVAIIRLEHIHIDVINPTNVKLSNEKFIFKGEGCLSFPGVRITTLRSRSIEFENQNQGYSVTYSLDNSSYLIVVAVQHELDHLNGTIFLEHQFDISNIGRNDLCPCNSGKKYKKCCITYEG